MPAIKRQSKSNAADSLDIGRTKDFDPNEFAFLKGRQGEVPGKEAKAIRKQLEKDERDDAILFWIEIGDSGSLDKKGCMKLLTASLLGAKTGGAALAVHDRLEKIVLWKRHDNRFEDCQDFGKGHQRLSCPGDPLERRTDWHRTGRRNPFHGSSWPDPKSPQGRSKSMSMTIQQAADAIASKAGWKPVSPDAEGQFRFSLEGGLDFSLFSPDGKTAILLAAAAKAPDIAQPGTEEELERVAALSAGALKSRESALGLSESNVFELSRTFSLTECGEQEMFSAARDFLNDLAWWKRQLEGKKDSGASPASFSPFIFPMNHWI